MENDDKTLISEIEGVDPHALTMVKMNRNGVNNWAIKNCNGLTTLFFTNVPFVIPYNDKSVLIIGEYQGRKNLYYVNAGDDPEDFYYRKIDTIGDLLYLKQLTEKEYIITTDRGKYLFDKETLREKSDLFDSIILMDNALFYKKIISHNDMDIVLYGELESNGKIMKSIFIDNINSNVFPSVPVISDEQKGYDIIDEDALEEELSKKIKGINDPLRVKLRTLHKLNHPSDFSIERR